jgi:hypothetical protein
LSTASCSQHGDHERHQHSEQQRAREQSGRDRAEHAAGKGCGGHGAFGVAHAQPGRHQRRIQPALGQEPPDNIDQLKRGEERIRDGTGAEQCRDHRIAHESEQARGQRSR